MYLHVLALIQISFIPRGFSCSRAVLQFLFTPLYNTVLNLEGREDRKEGEEPAFPWADVQIRDNDEILKASLDLKQFGEQAHSRAMLILAIDASSLITCLQSTFIPSLPTRRPPLFYRGTWKVLCVTPTFTTNILRYERRVLLDLFECPAATD